MTNEFRREEHIQIWGRRFPSWEYHFQISCPRLRSKWKARCRSLSSRCKFWESHCHSLYFERSGTSVMGPWTVYPGTIRSDSPIYRYSVANQSFIFSIRIAGSSCQTYQLNHHFYWPWQKERVQSTSVLTMSSKKMVMMMKTTMKRSKRTKKWLKLKLR